MNNYSAIAAAIIASATAFICAPAVAHGSGGWSVTIESQPQPYYSSPPPVFYPQSPYVYGPPPSAFAPPPPSPPVYQYQYQYRNQERWPGQDHRGPHGDRDQSWRDGNQHDRNSRDRWQNNDRPGPGANHDLPKWGYRERRH